MEPEVENHIRFWIVQKLVRHRVFGTHKINYDNLDKGNARYSERIYAVAEKMRKEGLLIIIPHKPKLCCYLNPVFRKFFEEKTKQGYW